MSQFDFIGFAPGRAASTWCNRKLSLLLRRLPFSVTSDAYLIQTRSGSYEGSIRLYSGLGTIGTHVRGGSLRAVILALCGNLRSKLAATSSLSGFGSMPQMLPS